MLARRLLAAAGGEVWEHSSAGRASALQAEGHWFEPNCSHHIEIIRTLLPLKKGSDFLIPFEDRKTLKERHKKGLFQIHRAKARGPSPTLSKHSGKIDTQHFFFPFASKIPLPLPARTGMLTRASCCRFYGTPLQREVPSHLSLIWFSTMPSFIYLPFPMPFSWLHCIWLWVMMITCTFYNRQITFIALSIL